MDSNSNSNRIFLYSRDNNNHNNTYTDNNDFNNHKIINIEI